MDAVHCSSPLCHRPQGKSPRADLEGQRGSTLSTVPQEKDHILGCSALLQVLQVACSVSGNEDAEWELPPSLVK